MTNKITIVITVDEQTDPVKVGEAIGNLIKTLTPPENWEAVAADLKAQFTRGWTFLEPPVNPEDAAPFDGSTDYEQWRQEEIEKAEERGDWG